MTKQKDPELARFYMKWLTENLSADRDECVRELQHLFELSGNSLRVMRKVAKKPEIRNIFHLRNAVKKYARELGTVKFN